MSKIDVAIDQFDFLAYVESHFDRVISCRDGGEYRINCPFCGDTKGHLYIHSEKKVFHCQRCKEGGTAISFVARFEGRTGRAVLEELLEGAIVSRQMFIETMQKLILGIVDEEEEEEEPVFISELPKEARKLFDGSGSVMMKAAERYLLKNKRISKRQSRTHEFWYAQDGMYGRRVIIPTRFDGKLTTFVARDVTGEAFEKYLNPPEATQGHWLYNWDRAAKQKEIVVVVEGAFDALGVDRAGIPSVATFGKKLTTLQSDLLSQFDTVVMLYDADAIKDAVKTSEKVDSIVKIAFLDNGDPGDNPPKVIRKVVEEACIPGSYAFVQQMIRRVKP